MPRPAVTKTQSMPPEEEVRAALVKILQSKVFAGSERMRRFLSYVVEQALSKRRTALKEYAIALAVYDKPTSFDPRLDAIVRVEAGRLRGKLREYYATEGADDDLTIAIRSRGYAPVFRRRKQVADSSGAEWSQAPDSAIASPDPSSIAVLPFVNLSREDEEYFCDGLTEEVINVLNRVDNLRIVARSSTLGLKARTLDVRKVGARLGVSMVLEGSVRKEGDRARVTARLIDVTSGYDLWSEAYDRRGSALIEIQEEIAIAIAGALKTRIAEPRAMRGTDKAGAYQLFLQGRHLWNRRSGEGLDEAIGCFTQAIGQDSHYALAFAGLADCFASQTWLEILTPEEGWSKARKAADQALAENSALSHPHATLGYLEAVYSRDWKLSERLFRNAIALDPKYATAHHWYAMYCLAPQRRLDEALASLNTALQQHAISPIINAHLGWLRYLRREYTAAIRQLKRTLELDPSFHLAYWYLGFAYVQESELDLAMQAFSEAHVLSGGQPFTIATLGFIHALKDDRTLAEGYLRELSDISSRIYVSPIHPALVWSGLNESEQAFDLLEKACMDRSCRMAHLKVEPAFDKLKTHPRFLGLLSALQLMR